MRDMIKERRDAEKKEERDDLFSSLLDASEAEADAQLKLSDTELVGQCQNYYFCIINCMLKPIYRKHLHLPHCWYELSPFTLLKVIITPHCRTRSESTDIMWRMHR